MDLTALAEEAVIHTCPLYEMRRMRAATSPRRNAAGEAAPAPLRWCNQFVHARQLLRAGTSRVVTPNNDTLYTNAWLDLGAGPLVIDVPTRRAATTCWACWTSSPTPSPTWASA